MPKSAPRTATVLGSPLACPVCAHNHFTSKGYMFAGKWQQIFDWEGFAKEGLMLICDRCAHVQYFASTKTVELRD